MRACNISPCLSLSMFRLPNDSKFHMIPIIRKFGQMTWHKRKRWDEKDYFPIFASTSVASQNLPIRCFYCSCLSSSSHHGRFDLSVLKTASGCSTCELGEVSMWPHVSRARLDMLNIVKLGIGFGILIGCWHDYLSKPEGCWLVLMCFVLPSPILMIQR